MAGKKKVLRYTEEEFITLLENIVNRVKKEQINESKKVRENRRKKISENFERLERKRNNRPKRK
jgi:hypothetical protein